MMSIRLAAAFAYILTLSAHSYAASVQKRPAEAVKLGTTTVALAKMPVVMRGKGREACGEYFHWIPGSRGGLGGVTFLLPTTGPKGESQLEMLMLGLDKVRVRVVEGLKEPIAVRTVGLPWVEVRLSREELWRSPCLIQAKSAA